MIRVIMIGGVLFVASAAASWFFIPQTSELQEGAADSAFPGDTLTPPEDALPVAVRPQSMTPEEILRHAGSLRAREQSLDERERVIEQREAQLSLVGIDIQGERQELEGLREAVAADTDALEILLQQTMDERQLLNQEREAARLELEEINRDRATFDQDETQNLRDLADILTPDTAATLIREYFSDGQREVAARLLSYFDERDASQILEAIGDPELIQELAEDFARLPRPQPRNTRR